MAPTRKIYALKRIRLTGRDSEAAAGFIDEITLLQRLRNKPNIIQLIDAEVPPPSTSARAQCGRGMAWQLCYIALLMYASLRA